MNSKEESKINKYKTPDNYFVYDFIKVTGAPSALIWLRPKNIYYGDSKKRIKGGAIVCCNHLGVTDPIYIHCTFWYRRLHFVAMKELFESGRSSWFFHRMHCIPIDRNNFNFGSFKEICKAVNRGKMVVLFPEGGINTEQSKISDFKSGIVLMAYKSGVPIVPIYNVPRKKWYDRLKTVVGEPINVKEILGDKPSMSDIEKVTVLLHEREVELMNYYNGKWKK